MNKSKLQEFCHQQSWPLSAYATVREGPDHDPRFTATVTVNGVPFQTTAFVCRSSKEAQNQAAKLAYDHFTAPKTILQRHNPALPEPSADAKLNIKTSVSGILPPTKLEGQNFQANQTSLNHEVVRMTKGLRSRSMDPARNAQESLDLVFHMSDILDTGLDRHTLSVLIALCDLGLNPEPLAAIVKEFRTDTTTTSTPATPSVP